MFTSNVLADARETPVSTTVKRVIAALALAPRKELPLPTRASEAQATEARTRAEANFKKEQRAKDGAQAMQEYLAGGRAVRERTELLKALRLAKEAADKTAEPTAPANHQPTSTTATALKPAKPRRMKNRQPR